MVRQTDIAQTIDLALDKAKYDECAKKLLSYKSIIAWILKSCTKEFSQYSIAFIMDHCLKGKAEISQRAVHQDQPDREERLDGDQRIDGLNTQANSIKEQTVYYDIRLEACVPGGYETLQLIINLEIQLDDSPGYPLVARGFYYCARMISEQYGTVFTKEHYEKLRKVYSIWICPDPAKKRQNGISRYHTVKERVYGNSDVKQGSYDLMEVVILNLGDTDEKCEKEILNLLNLLFSSSVPPEEKKKRLDRDFKIAMTEEFESEVGKMCNLSDAIEELAIQRGMEKGMEKGMQQGMQQGEELFAKLIQKLFALGRTEDVKRVAEDKEYRRILMEEFSIQKE